MKKDKDMSMTTLIISIVIYFIIKILAIVVLPSFLLSQVFYYFGLDISVMILTKIIVSVWLLSFVFKSEKIISINNK